MVAVGGDDMVVFAKKGNGAYRHRLLADVEVQEAAHGSLVVIFQRNLLEAPDTKHLPENPHFFIRGEVGIDFGFGEIHRIHGNFVFGRAGHGS